jgi:hypothetical protein
VARATRTCSPSTFRSELHATHRTWGLVLRRLSVSFIRLPQPGHSIVRTAPPNRSGMLPPGLIAYLNAQLKTRQVRKQSGLPPLFRQGVSLTLGVTPFQHASIGEKLFIGGLPTLPLTESVAWSRLTSSMPVKYTRSAPV